MSRRIDTLRFLAGDNPGILPEGSPTLGLAVAACELFDLPDGITVVQRDHRLSKHSIILATVDLASDDWTTAPRWRVTVTCEQLP